MENLFYLIAGSTCFDEKNPLKCCASRLPEPFLALFGDMFVEK
jgi:hypothetical protein